MTIPPSAARSRWRCEQGGADLRARPTRPRRRHRPPGRGRRPCDRRRRPGRRPAARRRRAASSTSSTSADEALRVVDRHAARLGQPGDRAVQQARVAEAVADLARGRGARRCSCPTSPARRGPRPVHQRHRGVAGHRAVGGLRAAGAPRGRGRGCPPPVAARARPGTEAADLGRLERADDPAAQAVDADGADPDANEPLDRRADRTEHPAQLALPALGQGRAVPGRAPAAARSQQLGQALEPRWRSSAAGRRAWPAPRRAGSRPASASTWSLSRGVREADARTRARRRGAGWSTRSAQSPSLVSSSMPSESWSRRPTG